MNILPRLKAASGREAHAGLNRKFILIAALKHTRMFSKRLYQTFWRKEYRLVELCEKIFW